MGYPGLVMMPEIPGSFNSPQDTTCALISLLVPVGQTIKEIIFCIPRYRYLQTIYINKYKLTLEIHL
jgi:hypothetical protein